MSFLSLGKAVFSAVRKLSFSVQGVCLFCRTNRAVGDCLFLPTSDMEETRFPSRVRDSGLFLRRAGSRRRRSFPSPRLDRRPSSPSIRQSWSPRLVRPRPSSPGPPTPTGDRSASLRSYIPLERAQSMLGSYAACGALGGAMMVNNNVLQKVGQVL